MLNFTVMLKTVYWALYWPCAASRKQSHAHTRSPTLTKALTSSTDSKPSDEVLTSAGGEHTAHVWEIRRIGEVWGGPTAPASPSVNLKVAQNTFHRTDSQVKFKESFILPVWQVSTFSVHASLFWQERETSGLWAPFSCSDLMRFL